MSHRLLLINIAGLGYSSIGPQTPHLSRLAQDGRLSPVEPPVPALTSPSQATCLTGTLPSEHGIVANGWYFRDLATVLNWQRSARLIQTPPFWEALREQQPELRIANLFWRYAAHSSCDVNLMERPTYWADGRKSPDFYSEPPHLHDELVEQLGPFPLFRFWGPAAGIESTRWIAAATLHLLRQERFDVLLTYLPHLDYDHQRSGPDSPAGQAALRQLDSEVGGLLEAAQAQNMRIAVVSDYAFESVSTPVFLNRVLRRADLLQIDRAANGELLEAGVSAAFAVCDQQVAHVYVNDAARAGEVRELVAGTSGVERVLGSDELRDAGLAHPRSGELLAVAAEDHWFAYPYWLDDSQAPDFARCVAIHDKPGFDPSELFLAPGLRGKAHLVKRLLQMRMGIRARFDVISGDASMVRGSHGRIPSSDAQRPVLICNWPHDRAGVIPMQHVAGMLARACSSES